MQVMLIGAHTTQELITWLIRFLPAILIPSGTNALYLLRLHTQWSLSAIPCREWGCACRWTCTFANGPVSLLWLVTLLIPLIKITGYGNLQYLSSPEGPTVCGHTIHQDHLCWLSGEIHTVPFSVLSNIWCFKCSLQIMPVCIPDNLMLPWLQGEIGNCMTQLRCGCCRSMYFIHNRRSARLGSKQWTSCVDGPNCKTYMALMSGLYTCFWLCTTVWSARVEKEIKVRISRGVEYRITLLSVINETAPHSILLIYKIHYVALLSSISRRQLGQEAPPPKHLSVVLPYAMIGASGNDRVHPDTF